MEQGEQWDSKHSRKNQQRNEVHLLLVKVLSMDVLCMSQKGGHHSSVGFFENACCPTVPLVPLYPPLPTLRVFSVMRPTGWK